MCKDKLLTQEEEFANSNRYEQVAVAIDFMIEEIKNGYRGNVKCLTIEDVSEDKLIEVIETMGQQGYIQLEFMINNENFITNKIDIPNGVINFEDFFIKKIRDNLFQLFPNKNED